MLAAGLSPLFVLRSVSPVLFRRMRQRLEMTDCIAKWRERGGKKEREGVGRLSPNAQHDDSYTYAHESTSYIAIPRPQVHEKNTIYFSDLLSLFPVRTWMELAIGQ